MVLSTAVKAGLGTVLVAGGIAGAAIGVTSMSKHPENVQRILDWEKSNGGCRIHMVVSTGDNSLNTGSLYRIGDGNRQSITDAHLNDLYKDLTERNKQSNENDCKRGKGKDLVLATRNSEGWKKDTDAGAVNKWKQRLPDYLQ